MRKVASPGLEHGGCGVGYVKELQTEGLGTVWRKSLGALQTFLGPSEEQGIVADFAI